MIRTIGALLALVFLLRCGAPGLQGPAGPAGDPGAGMDCMTDPSILPKVIWTNPENGHVGPLTDGMALQVQFNKIMDLSTIPFSATLSPVDSVAAFIDYGDRYSYSYRGDFITYPLRFHVDRRFRVNQLYTVTLSTSIADINGNTLVEPYTFSFMPEPYLRVLEFGWSDIDTTIPGRDAFCFTTNAPIDPASLAGNVSISPEAPGNFSVVNGYITFTQSAPLPPATTYTVTVGTGVTDTDGNHLAETYQQTFASGQ